MGSGDAPEKTKPASEGSSYTPPPSSYVPQAPAEPAASDPPPFRAATSGDREQSGSAPVKPRVEASKPTKAPEVALGSATPIAHSKAPEATDISGTPVAALADPVDQESSGSSALTWLLLIVAAPILGYGCFRLWRRHQRGQIEAVLQRRDATWKAVVHQIEMERTLDHSTPNGNRPKVDVG